MVSSESSRRCRNGHPVLATSASASYCVTCGAPISVPPPSRASTQPYTLTAQEPHAPAPPPPGHPMWTILNPRAILTAAVILATAVVLLAMVVASQL